MRTIIAGCVLVVFSFGVAVADDFFFSTTKIEKKDDSWVITGKKFSKKKDADAKEMTYTIDSKVKVYKGKFKKGDDGKFTVEMGDVVEAGFKDEAFKDEAFKDVSAEKSVGLYLTTDGDNKVTKVVHIQFQKKKKKDE